MMYIVKIETQNGTRLGLDAEEIDEVIEVVEEKDAEERLEALCEELGIKKFDSDVDIWL